MLPGEVLVRPLITEKGTTLQEREGKYLFEVKVKANKTQVKEAVEKAFGITVVSVNITKLPGKTKRAGFRIYHTPARKKAVVTLKPGDKIQLIEGV